MAGEALLSWTAKQAPWVQDGLRRIALSAGLQLNDDDRAAIRDRLLHAAGASPGPFDCQPLAADHVTTAGAPGARSILASFGPVEHVDRLAAGQQLRFATRGITLIYGENGSGKSGYARIAKALCRSLSAEALKGDVFKSAGSPATVKIRFKVGDEGAVEEVDWVATEPSPRALRQISVFDSQNARLYVDGQNRIAYLPFEIALLERHGGLCTEFNVEFQSQQAAIEDRLKTPLPAGYTPGGAVQAMLDRLDPNRANLPSAADITALATWSEALEIELAALTRKLALDPGAVAAQKRRARGSLTTLRESLAALEMGLSADVATRLVTLHADARATAAAAALAAGEQFSGESVATVGSQAWRHLYEAARTFATQADIAQDRLPEIAGEPCPLCLEPLSTAGAERLQRFNAFVEGESARVADAAAAALATAAAAVGALATPAPDVAAAALAEYASLDLARAARAKDLQAAFAAYAARQDALVTAAEDGVFGALPAVPSALSAILEAELSALDAEALALEQTASHAGALDADRARLANLNDAKRLSENLATVLSRRAELETLGRVKACQVQAQTRPVSMQISVLRRQLFTDALQARIEAEIARLDLTHIPFQVTDSSDKGQSRFAVSLQGAGKVANTQVLSEGEQRALALACFLAETSGEAASYGLILDDPVSSLDHVRIRRVAVRLVEEAAKGRQVVIFTHNLVFFNEVIAEAARIGDAAPLVKMVVRKTLVDGFGVVAEDADPWIAQPVNSRIDALKLRAKALESETDFSTEAYRAKAKDFYTDLRETWERLVEEIVLNKTIERLVPDVKTQSLKGVVVEDSDYKTIFFAMKRVSERSGHDMSLGRDIPVPTPDEMKADITALDTYRSELTKRRNKTQTERSALEKPVAAELI